MQAEIHALDEETTLKVVNFVQSVAEERATAEETATIGQWLRKKAGSETVKAIGYAIKDLATSVIADVITKAWIP
jgi:hypothetical protein